MADLNKIKGVIVGQYGDGITLTVVDKNGSAIDISPYSTSVQVFLRDPNSLKSLVYSASFLTDGADGKIRFTPLIGDIDRAGVWEGQIALEKATALAYTRIFTMEVEKRIGDTV